MRNAEVQCLPEDLVDTSEIVHGSDQRKQALTGRRSREKLAQNGILI